MKSLPEIEADVSASPSSPAPLELEFRITPKESAALIEEAVARRLLMHDRRTALANKSSARLTYALLAAVPLIETALFYLFDAWWTDLFGPAWKDTKTKALSIGPVAIVYWLLLWHYRKPLFAYLDARAKRIKGQRIRSALARIFHWSVSGDLKRLEGLHHVRIDQHGLHLKTPRSRRPAHVPWRKIHRIVDTHHFYKIFTATTQRFGLCYLVAKQSDAMDATTYQAGLQWLLDMSPVKPVADTALP